MQFIDYRSIDVAALQPLIEWYFSPSDHVAGIVRMLEEKYRLAYSQTCGVFYRGNDKATEIDIAPYDAFIARAKEIERKHPGISFLVQTDEAEFLEAFRRAFPNVIAFEEIPRIQKQRSTVHDELLPHERAAFGANFFAALLIQAKCKHLITHSGNCGLWAVLYRGSCDDVSQWLGASWERSWARRLLIVARMRYKMTVKSWMKRARHQWWAVVEL